MFSRMALCFLQRVGVVIDSSHASQLCTCCSLACHRIGNALLLFLSCSVAENLAAAAAAAPHVEPPEPPTTQPEQIKAVLRDYQVRMKALM